MKDFIISILICGFFLGIFLLGVFVGNTTKNQYPLLTKITYISESNDTIICVDYNGNPWQFKGVEDWQMNDTCILTMDSKGTPEIKDDTIVKTTYSAFEIEIKEKD